MARAALCMACAGMLLAVHAFAAVPKNRSSQASRSATRRSRAGQVARPTSRWLRSMSLAEKAGQLIVAPIYGDFPNVRSREYKRFVHLVREVRVGGLILVNRVQNHSIQHAEPYALAAFLNRMQRLSKIPLLVAADLERGAAMRVNSTTVFPQAMAFGAAGDPEAARFEAEVTAREARALGINWLLFPNADVNSNPDNPIINIRSFGEDPQEVSRYVRAFIQGARADRKSRVLTTAKHFPGHGDTSVDTHLNLASITGDRFRLDQVELVPFRAAIAEGVDSIMTAHIAVPALDGADVPATLSRAILNSLLREELGFRGLIVTDALDMGGIAKGFTTAEAAVQALKAGADVLLMPPDPQTAARAIVSAVRKGRLTEKRIDESVLRILSAKRELGLDRRKTVDLEAIADVVNAPESNQRAQEIADRAVTLVKNDGQMIPLKKGASDTCFLILTEGPRSTQGQIFQQQVRQRMKDAPVVVLDASMPDSELDAAAQKAAACRQSVVAAFVSVSAYRGDVALAGGFPKLIENLLGAGKPVALVAFGNPYLLRNFPSVAAYLATFSTVPPSELAAVKALFGEIPIRGHLPVTVPGIAKRGEGIQLTGWSQ